MTDKEQWKDIKGYEGLYQFSNTGRVRSVERTRQCRVNGGTIATMKVPSRVLKQWKRSSYLLVDLWKDSKRDVRSVHHLVYESFSGPVPKGFVVHHRDENKFNNSTSNLECLSQTEHLRLHNRGVFKAKISPQTRHKASKAGWITRKVNLKMAERNHSILVDKQAGMSVKEISVKYDMCTRQIYTILKENQSA